jgi:glycerate kinase
MILVAPTAFKGTIGAAAVARALGEGARRGAPGAEVVELPLSDGGPGLVDALAAGGGTVVPVATTGPLGAPARGRVLWRGGEGVVETADACGLHLIPAAGRDPLSATTYGVGALVRAAAGADRIVLGLGGSATVDGGAGLAQALGWRLLDDAGRPVPPGGGGLLRLARILPPLQPVALPPVVGLADVETPLLGPRGAAPVFAPQKGADADAVRILEAGLARLAERIEGDLGREVAGVAGGGAAGGLGAGIVAFLGGELVPGSAWVLEVTGFDALLGRARLLVTGEGSYDAQTGLGKVVGEAIRRARRARVPVLLVAGRIEAPPPPGVRGVDGAGRMLTPQALKEIAEREVPALLG